MRKYLLLSLALLCALALFVSCTGEEPEETAGESVTDAATDTDADTAADTDADATTDAATDTDTDAEPGTESDTATESESETETDRVWLYDPIDPATLTVTKTYDNNHGAILSSYGEQSADTYEAICVHYEQNGWDIWCENEWVGNRYTTYTKGSELAHVYRIDATGEVKIVTDATGADGLPAQDADFAGDLPTSVTQLQQQTTETSGMAYVVRLSDGSFIVYDGGYSNTVDQLLTEFKTLDPDGDIHIRAWIITHSHDDHYTAFRELSLRKSRYLADYGLTIQLDTVVVAPISDADALAMDDDGNFYATMLETCVEKFDGAKICYAHTGMTLPLGNVTVEILYTPEDLFIDGSTGYFNDSSIISRIRATDPGAGETLNMIFLGDAGVSVAGRLVDYYGDYLKSDMCQISHHGVENFPLSAYEIIAAPTLFYPCNNYLYALTDRDAHVRAALRESDVTLEILLRDNDKYTRYLNPALNPEPIGKPDASGTFPE